MFNEYWYAEDQINLLVREAKKVLNLPGIIIEIGCWEGRSTVGLANAVYPEKLVAVDSWEGNVAEDPNHYTVQAARSRDVYGTFLENIAELTKGNVRPVKQDCFQYLEQLSDPVKFCHIDASHDYPSVKRTIEMLKPKLVSGGVLCGDDLMNANRNRVDLQGGVQRAVEELCPDKQSDGQFWWWING